MLEMITLKLNIIFGLVGCFLALSAAAPSSLIYHRQVSNQTNQCLNTPAVFNETCWESLNMTSWLNEWSLPTCNSSDIANCCRPTENWSKCFLRVATGVDLFNCTQFNTGSCAQAPMTLSSTLNKKIVPEVWYVVKNIFAINAFFTTWNSALVAATLDASLISTELITAVDPEKKTHFSLFALLTALAVGLAFLVAPEIAPEALIAVTTAETLGVSAESAAAGLTAAGHALVVGLQQAPGVAKAMWPEGTSNTQSVQIGDIQSALGSEMTGLSENLNAALGLLMEDKASFAAFVQSGAFSGDSAPSIVNDTATLGLALRTFVVSTALSNNYYQGMIWENGASATNFLQHGTIDQYCNPGGGKPSPCFINGTNPTAYMRLGLQGKRGGDTATPLMDQIINNGWSTTEALFGCAFNCGASGHYGSGSLVSFGADGSLDLSCTSQMIMCNTSPTRICPSPLINGSCPIRWCVSEVAVG